MNPSKDSQPKPNVSYEQQILDIASIGVLITRISDGTILYANKMIASLLGIDDVKSVIGTTVPNFYWEPKERQTVLERFRAEGSVTDYELRARRADGSMLWVSISLQAFVFEGEHVLLSEINDITERKRAEQALTESQQRYQMIFNSSPVMFWLKDAKNNTLQINRAAAGFENVKPEDIEGRSAYDVYPREQAEAFYQDDLQVIRSGNPKLGILEKHTSPGTGKTTWLETGKVPVRDAAGTITGVLAFAVDVTEHREMERALHESEERFRRFVDATVEGLVFHEQGKVIDANPAALTMFGVAGNENFIGRNLLEFVQPEDHQLVLRQMQLEIVSPYEIRCIRSDGTVFPVETSTHTYKVGGKVVRASSIRDVTEYKKAEDERFRLQNAVEQGGDGVALADLSGNVTYSNPAWAKMHGYTPDEILGKHLSIFHNQEQLEQEVGPLNEKAMLVGSSSGEVGHLRRDGTTFPTLMTVAVQKDHNGIPVGLIGTVRDITDRKQAEQELRENQQILQTVMDNIPQLIFWKDRKSVYLGCNQNFAKAAGVGAPADIVGKSDYELAWKKEEADAFRQDDEVVMSSGQPKYHIIEPQLQADGRQTWADTNKIPMFNTKGEVVGVLGTYEDITERKQAEQALQEEKGLLDAVVNGLAGMFFLFDTQGNMIRWNKEYEKVLGYNTEETAARNAMDPIAEEDKERVTVAIGRSFTEGQGSVEASVVTRKGERIPYYFVARRFQLGDALYLAGTGVDITDRKHTEELLLQSEANLASALRVADMGYWEFDIATQMFTFNDQYYSLHGRTVQEVGGYQMSAQRFAQEFVHPEDAAVVGLSTQQAIESTDPNFQVQIEARIIHKDGQPRWVTVWFRVEKDEQGRTIKLHGVNQDITERKRLEARIREGFERRGYQVQVSNEISQEVAAATELEELFKRVVTLTKERLGYYHTQLLRYSAEQDAVVLINGYGETGRKMLESGHKMPMGSGLIGTAAATGETVMRSTLANDPDWKPNPLLPETRGEIAVPIKWQDNILGVLDVQSSQAGALTEDDRLLLEGLCGQIAIAMQSAELVETIRQNEARLGEALKITRLANWEYDVEKDIFTFNDQFYSIFHTTAEEVGGYQIPSARYAELFVYPDDAHLVGAEIGKALSTTERMYSAALDHRVRYADGGVGYITVKVTVERDETGKITRFYGANQDITERKQVEEALASERRLLRVLMSTMLDQVYVKDAEHRFLVVSDPVVRSLGAKTSDEVVGKTDFDFHPRELAEQYYADEQSLMDLGQPLIDHEEEILDRETGTYRQLSSTKVPLRDSQGTVIGLVGINHDITERKQAEDALRKSEQEMAERLDEISSLYRAMSHEGWKTYRERADLPAGFMFDQSGVKPVVDVMPVEEPFARIPMKVLGGEVVGSLTVANDAQHPMPQEDIDFLQQVSDQIALALESARLSEQMQASLAEAQSLYRINEAISSEIELGTVYQTVAQLSCNELGFSGSWIGVYEPGNNVLRGVAGVNMPAERITASLSMNDATPATLAARTHQLVTINNPEADERMQDIPLDVRVRMGKALSAPVMAGQELIGAIAVTRPENAADIGAREERMLQAIAVQLAVVMQRVNLFEQIRKQAEREAMLNVINQKIQSATSVEAVLQIAARELGHALGAPMTIAQLSMKDKK